MRQVNLYNREGQLVTVVNIRGSEHPEAIMWGIRFFVWSTEHERYQEARVSPAIIDNLN